MLHTRHLHFVETNNRNIFCFVDIRGSNEADWQTSLILFWGCQRAYLCSACSLTNTLRGCVQRTSTRQRSSFSMRTRTGKFRSCSSTGFTASTWASSYSQWGGADPPAHRTRSRSARAPLTWTYKRVHFGPTQIKQRKINQISVVAACLILSRRVEQIRDVLGVADTCWQRWRRALRRSPPLQHAPLLLTLLYTLLLLRLLGHSKSAARRRGGHWAPHNCAERRRHFATA